MLSSAALFLEIALFKLFKKKNDKYREGSIFKLYREYRECADVFDYVHAELDRQGVNYEKNITNFNGARISTYGGGDN